MHRAKEIREVCDLYRERNYGISMMASLVGVACDVIDKQAEQIKATEGMYRVMAVREREIELLHKQLKVKDVALRDISKNARRDTTSVQWIEKRAKEGLKGTD